MTRDYPQRGAPAGAACVAIGLLLLPLSAAAQDPPPPLESGDRVRITAPALGVNQQVGVLHAARHDSLIVVTDSTVAYPLWAVSRIDVYRGRKSASGIGAIVGGALGTTIGVLGGVFVANICGIDGGSDCPDPLVVGTAGGILLGAMGALLGAGVGSLFRSDRWEEASIDHVRVRVVRLQGGVGLGVSLGF
jgi:hypothetical protein